MMKERKVLLSFSILAIACTLIHGQSHIGIGTTLPLEKLDVAGGVKIGLSVNHHAGTLRFIDGEFQGNTSGAASGWKLLSGPWGKNLSGDYYYVNGLGSAAMAIGDSVATGKLYVRQDAPLLGATTLAARYDGNIVETDAVLAGKFLDIQTGDALYYGVSGSVLGGGVTAKTFAVHGMSSGNGFENYGGFFEVQGLSGLNIGVLAKVGSPTGYAGVFLGRGHFSDKIGIAELQPTHQLHVAGNNQSIRLEGTQGLFNHGARLNFGDGDYTRLEEFGDDSLLIYARQTMEMNTLGDISLVSSSVSMSNKLGVAVTDIPKAALHIGGGETVLFGRDTVGDGAAACKLMWLPGQGGAFRAGMLNFDGSVGNGTVFWDPVNIGWGSVALGFNTRADASSSVAIGVRAHASTFGAVALGHLSRAMGNSAVAAGYYTRADAFLSVALGAGNVGGGQPHFWVTTDPIFEVGNSPDTSNRHNAMTILKNGKTGLNTSQPEASLHIKQLGFFAEDGLRLEYSTDTDHWETWVDVSKDYNFAYNGSLKGYIRDTDGAYVQVSDKRFKTDIQPLKRVLPRLLKLEPSSYHMIGATKSTTSLGFVAQTVIPIFPEVVDYKNDQYGINYQGLSVVAVKAIQELAHHQVQLEATVSELLHTVEALEHQLKLLQEKDD